MLITRKEYISIISTGLTQALDDTTLTAEKKYSILLRQERHFVQACIIMEQIFIYLLMVQEFTNLKQKILKL